MTNTTELSRDRGEAAAGAAVSPGSTNRPAAPVIVAAADQRFAMPLAVTMYSAARNYRGPGKIKAFLISSGILEEQKSRVSRVLASLPIQFEWIEVDDSIIAGLPISGHISHASYIRLLLPDLLPEVDDVIYLDSDLVILGSLDELWALPLEDHAVLAAQEQRAPLVSSPAGLLNFAALGLRPDEKYFNSGIMRVNLRLWRQDQIGLKVIEYLNANRQFVRWWDQDGLNAVLARRTGILDSTWNYASDFVSAEAWSAGERPAILHFLTRNKPWSRSCRHWTRRLFDRYLRESGWFSRSEWITYRTRLGLGRTAYSIYANAFPRGFGKSVQRLRGRLLRTRESP